MGIAAVSILVLTLLLALARPRIVGFRFEHASAAVLGASLCLLFGLVSGPAALDVLGMLAEPVVTIVSLMIITLISERAGLLDWLAERILRRSRGSGFRLFTLIFIAGSLFGMVFTNDAAVLLFTPMVFVLVEAVAGRDWTARDRLPFYFAVLYVGNVAAALVIGNPINLIVAGYFDIGFVDYARWMALPSLASIVVSYIGLRIAFAGRIPARLADVPSAHFSRSDSPMLTACAVVLLLTLVGFFVQGLTGVSTGLVAAAGAGILLALNHAHGHPTAPVLRGVGWDVILFVLGIFIVATGLRQAGVTAWLGDTIVATSQLPGVGGLLNATGLTSAAAAAVINNHPTAGLMIGVIEDFQLLPDQQALMVYAALIGGDLGPKMLPIGSLAALMWFRMLRDRGVEVSYLRYIALGIPITLAALLAALLVLQLQASLVGVTMPEHTISPATISPATISPAIDSAAELAAAGAS